MIKSGQGSALGYGTARERLRFAQTAVLEARVNTHPQIHAFGARGAMAPALVKAATSMSPGIEERSDAAGVPYLTFSE